MSSSRKRDVESADATSKRTKVEGGRDEDVLDPDLEQALSSCTEAFIANEAESFDTLTVQQATCALEIAQKNTSLVKLGMDGTGCPLPLILAAQLGALAVKDLKFVGLAFASEASRAAFVETAGRNATLEGVGIFETNADGEWGRFKPSTSAFVASLQAKRATAKLAPLRIEQIDDSNAADDENGDEAGEQASEEEGKEEGEEEGEEEDEEEEEDYVLCDGKLGPGRRAIKCGKKLRGEDAVFTTPFGQDYCAACNERLVSGGATRTVQASTAAERIAEDVTR